MISLFERYRALVSERGFESDPAQAKLVGRLDVLAVQLKDYKAEAKPTGFSRLFGVKPAEPPRGLYIHGPVGRGKTMLMDMLMRWRGRPSAGRISRLHGRRACPPQ